MHYLEKNRLRRRAIHRRMQNLNYVNKLFWRKQSQRIFQKYFRLNITLLFQRKLASSQRDTEPRTYVNKLFCCGNKHKDFLQIFF